MAYTAERTSGENKSYWIQSTEKIEYKVLNGPASADVVIIGAGISGLTTAYSLLKSGKSIIVIEDGYIGSGETGRTTAHLVNVLDDRYYELEQLFGKDYSRLAAESHGYAVDYINRTVLDENIDCDFVRVDGYLFLDPTDDPKNLQKEFRAALEAGINVEFVNDVPGITGIKTPAIKFSNQATFHPMKYLKGLCDAIVHKGGTIYTRTHADEVTAEGVKANGFKIKANNIVVATNTPINKMFVIHTKQAPYRTYVIGTKVKKGTIPNALWWDTGDHKSEWPTNPYHYVRLQPYDESFDLLITGGEDHKTAQQEEENKDEESRYKNLFEWTKMHFPAAEKVDFRWSGNIMEPVDHLGFIGKDPAGPDNVFLITGDSGNGMTNGTIGGILVTDLINNTENPWAEIYAPSRKTMKTADVFIEEQVNVAKQYLRYLTPGDIESIKDLENDSGAIIREGLNKIAVYRDAGGKIFAFSAICPHLKCILGWNRDEKTWDCPCHGSRFSNIGKVINGPANKDLEPVGIPEKGKRAKD